MGTLAVVLHVLLLNHKVDLRKIMPVVFCYIFDTVSKGPYFSTLPWYVVGIKKWRL